FDPDRDALPHPALEPLDRWAVAKNAEVVARVREAYEAFEFHQVFHAAYNYFTVDLSAFYLDVLKDRLYCSGRTSPLRRSAQTALFRILVDSLRLLAPLLPFTAEEAWEAMPAFRAKEESVHLAFFPPAGPGGLTEKEAEEWAVLLALRERVLKELEKARELKAIGHSLEARVRLSLPPSWAAAAARRDELRALFIVSEVELEAGSGEEPAVVVERASGGKCLRCWNYDRGVGASAGHPDLCPRCESVVRRQAE
ncbi:MAG: class I tRNA ligase family protein, partial [Candidatus Aminicenantes bacterium]|nr:class I tRNA ligase family protein [Candidatus Aminicenantes bacterium]